MIQHCPTCGKHNRIGAVHLATPARCGACRAPLGPIAHPIDVDAEVFDDVRQHATVPVLVDFWAEWCGPCRRAAPEVTRTAAAFAGRAIVLKVDTERHPDIASRFQIRSIPTFVVLKDGQVVSQQAGLVGHAEMTRWLQEAGA